MESYSASLSTQTVEGTQNNQYPKQDFHTYICPTACRVTLGRDFGGLAMGKKRLLYFHCVHSCIQMLRSDEKYITCFFLPKAKVQMLLSKPALQQTVVLKMASCDSNQQDWCQSQQITIVLHFVLQPLIEPQQFQFLLCFPSF